MSRTLPRLLVFVLLAGAALVAAQTDDEGACEVDREVFSEAYRTDRMTGTAERLALLRQLAPLIERYETTAPVCGGRLRGHQAFLYVMDEDYETLIDTAGRYLAGPGRGTSAKSQVALFHQIAYAYSRLNQPIQSVQAYFDGAARASDAPAYDGSRALIVAASAARQLGDAAAAERYLDAAFSLIADSLETNPDLAPMRGQGLVGRGFLTEARLESAPADQRPALIADLEATSEEAFHLLPEEGQWAGFKALAANQFALAAAYDGRYDDATQRLAPSFDLARRTGGLLPAARFEALMTQGEIQSMAGDAKEAASSFRAALDDARGRGATAGLAGALERLGGLAEARGDLREARAEYTEAIAIIDAQRSTLGLSDWSISAFVTDQGPYRGLARLQVAEGDVAAAFATIEQTRARYLLDLRRHLAVRRALSPSRRAEADSLSDRLAEVRLAAIDTSDASAQAALAREASALRQALAELAPLTDATLDSLNLPALQAHLGGRTLLSYTLGETASTVFVVRADTLLAVPLNAPIATVRALMRQAGSVWRGDAPDPAFALRPLHELYRLLVAPVRPHVSGDKVILIPDAEIATLPFALLPTAPAEEYASAPYLLHEWTISTELSASLVATAPTPREAGTVLALGRSTFDGFTWNNAPLGPLSHVEAEIEAIGGYGVAIQQATEATFDSLAAGARVIHLASHAQAASVQPLYSRIALGGGGGEDGTLHLYEILETPLAADLVVLSGCETGGGSVHGSEGVVGLEYGVRAAGAAAAVATRWSVADRATAEIMGTFYEKLADGLPKDEALRQAQLIYLASSDGVAASPFYWAAPVLSGSPAPIPLDDGTNWWPALLIAATIGSGLAWRYKQSRPDA
ncbi:CHAT domain-containing protein [Rubrivirga sp. IMCC43871]|uniref:CHAT domain-containing protein n=1 Tax=Rubrivirga sp. IMCC43871 TaxID=3391575 RepID=UPI0039900939